MANLNEISGLRMNGNPVKVQLKTIKEGKKDVTYAVLGTAKVYNDEQAQVHGYGYLHYKDNDNEHKK